MSEGERVTHWNYRVLKIVGLSGEIEYHVIEAYYSSDLIVAWGDSVTFADSVVRLSEEVARMCDAIHRRPVTLDFGALMSLVRLDRLPVDRPPGVPYRP